MDPKNATARVFFLESIAVLDGNLGFSRRLRNISGLSTQEAKIGSNPYPTPPIPVTATRLSTSK